MTTAAGVLLLGLLAVAAVGLMGWFVAFPIRTIFALYAASLPLASAIRLSVPFPPPFNTLSTLFGGLAILAALLHVILRREGRIPTLPIAFWFLFLAWATLTVFWADDAQASQQTLLVALPLLVLLALASIVPANETDLEALRIGIILSGMLVGAYASYLLLTGAQLPLHGKAQRFSLSAEQTDPNILAASLLLPLALSIERVVLGGVRWMGHRTWIFFGAAGTLLTMLAIVMTGSRGGLLAMVLVFVLSLYLCSRLPGGRQRVLRILAVMAGATALTAFLAVASLLVVPGGIAASVRSSPPIERITENKADSSGRVEIWSVGLFACRTECAWGAGIGNFPNTFNNLYPFAGLGRDVGQQRPAHNVYLSVVVETGIVGLTLFLLALAAEWSSLSSPVKVRLAPALRPALLGLLLASVFLSAVWFKYFWLVFVLVRVVEGVAENEPDAPIAGRLPELARNEGLVGVLPSRDGFS